MCGVQGEHRVAFAHQKYLRRGAGGAPRGPRANQKYLRRGPGGAPRGPRAHQRHLRSGCDTPPDSPEGTEEQDSQDPEEHRGDGARKRDMATGGTSRAANGCLLLQNSKAEIFRARTNQTKFKGCSIVGVDGHPKKQNHSNSVQRVAGSRSESSLGSDWDTKRTTNTASQFKGCP